MTTRTYKILWIRAAITTPPTDPAFSPPAFLSERVHGDYLAVWPVADRRKAREILPTLKPFFGRFRFHYVRRGRWRTPFRQIREIAFYVWRGLRLARSGNYDAVVAYGLFSTGYSAYVVARLTGTPFILEIAGNPWKSFSAASSDGLNWKARLAPLLARFIMSRADYVKVLYPSQIPEGMTSKPPIAFHNFVPISAIRRGDAAEREPYMVLIGSPLYLKGADLLLTAFNRIASDYPEWSLKIIGHAPDYRQFEEIAGGSDRIEILGPLPRVQTLELLRRASLLVHPSRTEAMPRVLLEAMASGTPILASTVGGIPHYLDGGERGALFETEDVDDLEAQLRRLLSDPAAAQRVADTAFRYVHAELSESRYVEHFSRMLETAAS